MDGTLSLMKSILTGKEQKTNENELIKKYQDEALPNILAYFYVNNFGLIKRISMLYPILLDEDKASFCLQELDKCLLNFDFSLSIKFNTYFSKCLKVRLITESEVFQRQKRKIWQNSINIESVLELYTEDIYMEDIDYILDNYNLSSFEKVQCKLLNYGYTIKEIAKILKQATITIYKRNDKIKQKILN